MAFFFLPVIRVGSFAWQMHNLVSALSRSIIDLSSLTILGKVFLLSLSSCFVGHVQLLFWTGSGSSWLLFWFVDFCVVFCWVCLLWRKKHRTLSLQVSQFSRLTLALPLSHRFNGVSSKSNYLCLITGMNFPLLIRSDSTLFFSPFAYIYFFSMFF